MSQEFPYSVSTTRVKEFFGSIQKMGTPKKVNTSVLPSLGYKSTNDRAIVSILRALELIDATGVPTPAWQLVKSKQTAPAALADKIRVAYADLFSIYPDAHARSENEIRDFIQGRSKGGERVVAAIATTFKVLCSLADFSADPQQNAANGAQDTAAPPSTGSNGTPPANQKGSDLNLPFGISPQVTINLQLQLPDGADADFIDNVFESMARHLLGRQPAHEEVTFEDEEQPVDDGDTADDGEAEAL